MKNYQEQFEKPFADTSIYQKAALLRVKRNKSLAKKRLYPLHGEDWEQAFQQELKRTADISRLELQIAQMDSRETAEWIYELHEKQNEKETL
ncbi:conserved hypothetical protein [Vibrio phage 249E41-1]|nr:conserved hypothetical protein [Vibrio phage 249E41-1]